MAAVGNACQVDKPHVHCWLGNSMLPNQTLFAFSFAQHQPWALRQEHQTCIQPCKTCPLQPCIAGCCIACCYTHHVAFSRLLGPSTMHVSVSGGTGFIRTKTCSSPLLTAASSRNSFLPAKQLNTPTQPVLVEYACPLAGQHFPQAFTAVMQQ